MATINSNKWHIADGSTSSARNIYIDNIDNIVNNNICNIKDELISKCKYLFTQGILDVNCLPIDVSKNNINLDIEDYINKNITQISNNIIELLNNNIFNDKYLLYQNKLIINSVFNILSDIFVYFINFTLEKSYNYGLYLGI